MKMAIALPKLAMYIVIIGFVVYGIGFLLLRTYAMLKPTLMNLKYFRKKEQENLELNAIILYFIKAREKGIDLNTAAKDLDEKGYDIKLINKAKLKLRKEDPSYGKKSRVTKTSEPATTKSNTTTNNNTSTNTKDTTTTATNTGTDTRIPGEKEPVDREPTEQRDLQTREAIGDEGKKRYFS